MTQNETASHPRVAIYTNTLAVLKFVARCTLLEFRLACTRLPCRWGFPVPQIEKKMLQPMKHGRKKNMKLGFLKGFKICLGNGSLCSNASMNHHSWLDPAKSEGSLN